MLAREFLHNRTDFPDLIRTIAENTSIAAPLVEKDYWIMHCLFGLQQNRLQFELKGGTSLSKGFELIHRFSEDIDIRIEPPEEMEVKTGRNHDKPAHAESRRNFYDWLADSIKIDGITEITRDADFDDERYRNGGIRLSYKTLSGSYPGLKDGILLEVGFDDITPNLPKTISSWAYDFAVGKVQVADNRAIDVLCYHPGFTLVEKLQTISTKYRNQQASGVTPINFMRHYYDVYCLLQDKETNSFIGTPEYKAHKEKRFRAGDNPKISENEAFLLSNTSIRESYSNSYQASKALYYKSQPNFETILEVIQKFKDIL